MLLVHVEADENSHRFGHGFTPRIALRESGWEANHHSVQQKILFVLFL